MPRGERATHERVLQAVTGTATQRKQDRDARESPQPGKRANSGLWPCREQAGSAGPPRICWAVGAGASRHVVPPQAAGSQLRPTDVKVQTANGVVPAAGIATVPVPDLGHSLDALVLQHSPCFLCAGGLVCSGYTFSWEAMG